MTQLIGHFHPVLVHLPIGILILAFIFHWLIAKPRYAALRPALGIMLLLGLFCALASCVSGYLLSLSGDYDEELVGRHQNLGLITTALSLGWYYVYVTRQKNIYQHGAAIITFLGIVITGHLGGSITHGTDYLSKAFNEAKGEKEFTRKPIPDVQSAQVYGDVIQPLLQEKCYGCHGASKQKGKLRLDQPEHILKGGEDGKVVIPGNVNESDLVKRILLPIDNDDHMPPKEKGQLKENDIALLHWWIENGAAFDKQVKDISQTERIQPVLLALESATTEKPMKQLIPAAVVEPAPAEAIDQLKKKGVIILPVARNTNYLLANFVNADSLSDKDMALLLPVKKQLVWLKLSNRPLGDSAMKLVSQCTNLLRLQLDHTKITDSGLVELRTLTQLQSLNLVGTAISVSGLIQLRSLQQLESLYLYKTSIPITEWERLKQVFPKAVIDTGGYKVPVLPSDTSLVRPEKKK